MIYELNYNLISGLDFLALIQGLVFGIILIIKNTKARPSLLLGLFLISFTIESLDVILEEIGVIDKYPELIFLPFNFYFLSLPLLYLYTKKLIQETSLKDGIIILVPGLLEFLITFILFLFPGHDKLNILDSDFTQIFIEVYDYSSIIFSIYFTFLIFKLISKHKVNLNEYFSNLKWKQLKWMQYFTGYILLQYSLILVFSFFPHHDDIFSVVCSITNLIIIYWVGISGLIQLRVEKTIETPQDNHAKKEDPVYPSILKISKSDNAFSYLLTFIKENQTYKDHELTLDSLSQQSGISKRNLSQIINNKANTNFNRFINEFRVDEAKSLLLDPNYNRFNIQGIAFESGFKSKATFYAMFKQIVGMTPKQYQQHAKT